MGTNFYMFRDCCDQCGRGEELHIGKSSGGWCFSLHIYPEKGINTLDDWKVLFNETVLGGIDGKVKQKNVIKNEYNNVVSPEDMLRIITDRGYAEGRDWSKAPMGYASWGDFHYDNHSEQGPEGLIRHKIGPWCCGHGEGTWDYMEGEFS